MPLSTSQKSGVGAARRSPAQGGAGPARASEGLWRPLLCLAQPQSEAPPRTRPASLIQRGTLIYFDVSRLCPTPISASAQTKTAGLASGKKKSASPESQGTPASPLWNASLTPFPPSPHVPHTSDSRAGAGRCAPHRQAVLSGDTPRAVLTQNWPVCVCVCVCVYV